MECKTEINMDYDTKWLWVGLFIAAGTAVINYAEKQPLAWIIWIGFTLFYAQRTRNFKGIGLTKEYLKSASIAGAAMGAAYGLLRGLILVFIPSLNIVFESGLTRVMNNYLSGTFPVGGITVSPLQFMIVFIVMSAVAVVCWEIFYRGFLFTRISQYISWPIAAVLTSFINGLGHLDVGVTGLYHSMVLFTISAALMYKYKNIAAPILFHYIHFFVAFTTVLFLR